MSMGTSGHPPEGPESRATVTRGALTGWQQRFGDPVEGVHGQAELAAGGFGLRDVMARAQPRTGS